MTAKALAKLTDRQRKSLDNAKSFLAKNRQSRTAAIAAREYIKAYLDALRDSEIITDTDRRCLFTYATL